MKKEVFRILDANLNRSREGLRVCEEVARFVLNSPAITKELKSIRHAVASSIQRMSAGSQQLFGSRNAEDDVGRSSKMATEMKRAGYTDIFVANIQRVKESLRVLEEFSKLLDTGIAIQFQRLRFRTYTIEKKAVERLAKMKAIG